MTPDRKKLARALVVLMPFTDGLRSTLRYTLVPANRNGVLQDIEAVAELIQLGNTYLKGANHVGSNPHLTLRSPDGSTQPHVREVSRA